MVFRRIVKLDMVDELIGGVTTLVLVARQSLAEHVRVRTGNRKYFEWCQWLAERITERRAKLGHEPAHIRHAGWRDDSSQTAITLPAKIIAASI